jgi:transcriptional regulator with GAF, ATPase, and Fis domain
LILTSDGRDRRSQGSVCQGLSLSLSNRFSDPMISINCGSIPCILGSELSGHEKGASTDASNMKLWYFEQADRGSIFLDEIGELVVTALVIKGTFA